jgi:hypothetical protein
MALEWPRFEPAAFSGWDSVPDEVRKALIAARVPQRFFGRRYSALAEPILVAYPNGTSLVRFGQTMVYGGIYLNPSTGEVLELVDHPGATPLPVNTTLDRFTTTVEKVLGMFPFYSDNSELEDRVRVAKEIGAAIRQIDPFALSPDSFWATFLDDVINGDFATEDVVGASQR